MYKYSGKRILDIIIAGSGLIILSPLFALIVIILWFQNNGKPFFYQPRPGLHSVIFTMIKFRTMTEQKNINENSLTDGQRITKIGSSLRRTSLDEIPQLWNVFRGNMSIVGPRPLLTEYLPLYNSIQQQRHDVKPGITGWAQVNGRNSISWKKKFEYDVWYVENLSLRLDIKIILLTVLKILKPADIKETAIAEKFIG